MKRRAHLVCALVVLGGCTQGAVWGPDVGEGSDPPAALAPAEDDGAEGERTAGAGMGSPLRRGNVVSAVSSGASSGGGGCHQSGTCSCGTPCSANTECNTGFCVDGVCCEHSCSGVCWTCTQPGSVGWCNAHFAGTDPDSECPGSACDGAGACIPLSFQPSCAAILATDPAAMDGVHTIDPDGTGGEAPFDVYCDMTTEGGGWTLAMKVDGTNNGLTYLAPEWTNTTLLNPTSIDITTEINAKYQSFNSVPFTSVLIGMRASGSTNAFGYRVLPLSDANLTTMFNGSYQPTNLGRTQWLSMVPGMQIQPNCNAEGVNYYNQGSVRIRLGIAGNNETNCGNPDSYAGLGGGTHGACYPYINQPASGSASCYPKSKQSAFALLYIR